MREAAIILLSLAGILGGQTAVDEQDPSERAYAHFRSRYQLYSTIGDFDAEEFRTLRRMNVAGSEFGDDDIPFLAGLASLRILDLTGTLVTDQGLEQLAGLDISLRTLILSDTKVTATGLGHLSSMKWLEELDLSGTELSGEGIAQLPGFEGHLTSLKLGAQTSDADLQVVGTLGSLRTLHIPTDAVTPAGMQYVAKLESLRELRLHGTRLTPRTLAQVATLENLERLDVSGYGKLNDKALQIIMPLKSLQFLDVSDTAITDKGLAHVVALPELTHLVLSDTGVTDAGIELLGERVWGEGDDFSLKTATAITHLELASTVISDRGLHHLGALNLTHLDISHTLVSNRAQKFLTQWPLKSLKIEGDLGLTELGFIKDLPELEELDVSHRPRIMSQISHLDRHPNLAILDISFTDLKDSAMMKLVRCEKLRQISVAGTEVTLPSLIALAKLGTLELVNVRDTNINVAGPQRRAALPGIVVSRAEEFPGTVD